MRSSSRVLLGFGIALGVLVIATIILAFTLGQRNIPLLDESTPEGTVQRYLLAIQEREFQKAYSYIYIPPTPTPPDPKLYPPTSYEFWIVSAENAANRAWKATLGRTTVTGDIANVGVTVEVFQTRGIFENPVSTNTVNFALQKSGGVWLITTPVDVYWVY